MEDETGEQLENSKVPKQLQPYMYKKGQSGNPSGRPEGISLKEYARLKFRRMTPEEREDFFEGMNKIDIFKMAEGNPASQADITTGGEKIATVNPTDPVILASLKAIQDKLENE